MFQMPDARSTKDESEDGESQASSVKVGTYFH